MSADLVARLRTAAFAYDIGHDVLAALLREAADELERMAEILGEATAGESQMERIRRRLDAIKRKRRP